MKSSPDLSIVIACYNEEDILVNNVKEVVDVLDATRFAYEFIFIDDCSQDNTRELINSLIGQYAASPVVATQAHPRAPNSHLPQG